MTNREYLESLDNEKLAEEIYKSLDYFRNHLGALSEDFDFKEGFLYSIEHWLKNEKTLF